jgi:hypothetical protein
MKLSWRGGRVKGNESVLLAAAAPPSVCAILRPLTTRGHMSGPSPAIRRVFVACAALELLRAAYHFISGTPLDGTAGLAWAIVFVLLAAKPDTGWATARNWALAAGLLVIWGLLAMQLYHLIAGRAA